MNTRSKDQLETNNKGALYEVNIDFDEASTLWRHNKKAIGEGHFKYICTVVKKDGIKCGRTRTHNSEFCWGHRGQNKDKDMK